MRQHKHERNLQIALISRMLSNLMIPVFININRYPNRVLITSYSFTELHEIF